MSPQRGRESVLHSLRVFSFRPNAVFGHSPIPTVSSSKKKAESIPSKINIRVDFDNGMMREEAENRRLRKRIETVAG